jgi:hypothetical protein
MNQVDPDSLRLVFNRAESARLIASKGSSASGLARH